LNLGVHRDYVFMAKETLFDFRQPRMLAALDIGMTEAQLICLTPACMR